ncbi:hypothetical protein B5F83_01450 [Muribaculum sp. An289]|uniref:RNA polymerase sigma factor n=1 Tax=unclassified Muribaculum TaxID=2622126 RepID=UPI000B3AB9C6|nr:MULTISPECIES: RNA polymerase sigma factor [unclassified Muribaculum]OUO38552.1 hypothetical protein B5F83_01450 [Muribaculum sp. An289]OUO44043.1 hypothetical protein B5F81_02425 [Muribaculum sp. An287]
MDTAGFKQCMMPYARQMYAVALSILKDSSDAEDVVQDVFLRMWEKRSGMSSVTNLKAYLLSAVRNRSFDIMEKRRSDGDKGVMELSDEGKDAGQTESKDAVSRIIGLIAALPEPQRTVISMHDIEGMEYDEISRLTGMNEGALRTALSRARRRIREIFKG